MSQAIPMALRPAARVTQQWNTVTLAFARRYCAPQPCFQARLQSPIVSALPPRSSPVSRRAFSTSLRYAATVQDPPAEPAIPPKKRTVKIGPLPDGAVDEWTIKSIFGGKVSRVDGNAVLRILHHRRTSGSLADYGVDNLGAQLGHVKRETALKGLDWLRERYPLDEARAAEEWAEKEANRIAYELWLADPENESKYKDPERVFKEKQDKEKEERELEERQQGQRMGLLHAGPSQFERNIEEKRRQRLEEITKKAEEKERIERENEEKLASGEWVRTPSGTQLMKPGQDTYVDIFGREQVSRVKEQMEEYRKKATTDFKDEAEMLARTTLTQRLVPMTAFVSLVCVLSWLFATYWEPPHPNYRIMADASLTTATLITMIGMNIVVFIGWRIGILWPVMTRYMMHVPGYPRAVQSVTNIFSHVQGEHLLSNMFALILVGPVCHELVGRGIFLGTYIAAGAVGTLFSLYWANLGRGSITSHSVGASAAIWGIVSLYLLLTDQETLTIPFLKDMSVTFFPKVLFAILIVTEFWAAFRKEGRGTLDYASHFGGMFAGISVAGYMRATGWHQRREAQAQVQSAEEKAGIDKKTVDLEALIKQEFKEIEEQAKKVVKK